MISMLVYRGVRWRYIYLYIYIYERERERFELKEGRTHLTTMRTSSETILHIETF